ncbi:hypothetical protein [Natrialba magadii]|nr:hypothetical protein [Natrialba magadii]
MIQALRPVVALAATLSVTTALSRRAFAALAGGVLAFLAGCLDTSSSTDRTPTNAGDTEGAESTNGTNSDHAEADETDTTELESIDNDVLERAAIRPADESEPWDGTDGVYGVRIANTTDEPVDTTVELVHDGDGLLSRNLELPARGDVVLEFVAAGEYELSVETADGTTESAIDWEPEDCETGVTELTVGTGGSSTAVSISC